MLISISLGSRIHVSIRIDKDLLERMTQLENEVQSLAEDHQSLQASISEYALAANLADEYLAKFDDLRSRIENIDYFKADRHHAHKDDRIIDLDNYHKPEGNPNDTRPDRNHTSVSSNPASCASTVESA